MYHFGTTLLQNSSLKLVCICAVVHFFIHMFRYTYVSMCQCSSCNIYIDLCQVKPRRFNAANRFILSSLRFDEDDDEEEEEEEEEEEDEDALGSLMTVPENPAPVSFPVLDTIVVDLLARDFIRRPPLPPPPPPPPLFFPPLFFCFPSFLFLLFLRGDGAAASSKRTSVTFFTTVCFTFLYME
jgi:hypothetical protein